MKSDDIQRAVRANRHDRATGDAPSMGRVSRMPGTGMPKGARRKKRRSDGARGSRLRESKKAIVITWSILLSLGVVAALGVAVWLWLIPQMNRPPEIARQIPPDPELEARLVSKFPSPTEGEALALVNQALAVRDPEKVPDYFRLGSANPAQVVDFLLSMDAIDGAMGHSVWLGSVDANRLSIDGVVVHFKGQDRPRNRLALLTPDEAGKWRVDFESFARVVTPAWNDLIEKRADVATVRVYLAKDNYYNGPFIDDKQWTCYGIASPDTTEVLLGYCKIGSPQAAALESIFTKDAKLIRATLEIRRPPSAPAKQFEISRVLAEDWVLGPVPFDETFQ